MSDLCRKCERPLEIWEASVDHPYQYTESGLPNVRLAGITVYSCPNCEADSADIPNLDGLHDLISRDIILTPLPMTGAELRFLRKEARLKPKQLAERLGVDPKTISNWESSDKLSRQVDIPVRVLIAGALWEGKEVLPILQQLSDLLKYGWDEPWEETEQDIAKLAADNTILGIDEHRQWGMAA